MWKPTKNPIILELTKSIKDRSYNLSNLKTIKLPELTDKGKNKKLCAWCAETEIFRNTKYCSSDCSESAMAWAYPQKEDSLRFLLSRQDWKCLTCNYDYSGHLSEIVDRNNARTHSYSHVTKDYSKLSWFFFKRLKDKVPDERRPEVDHVIPIYKGGQSLGFENHQILCSSCHREKTKKDLSGKRKNV